MRVKRFKHIKHNSNGPKSKNQVSLMRMRACVYVYFYVCLFVCMCVCTFAEHIYIYCMYGIQYTMCLNGVCVFQLLFVYSIEFFYTEILIPFFIHKNDFVHDFLSLKIGVMSLAISFTKHSLKYWWRTERLLNWITTMHRELSWMLMFSPLLVLMLLLNYFVLFMYANQIF